jgi:hypothetical protein
MKMQNFFHKFPISIFAFSEQQEKQLAPLLFYIFPLTFPGENYNQVQWRKS